MSVKQYRYLCSGPSTDSTNYQKCISNFLLSWLANWANHGPYSNPGTSLEQGYQNFFPDGLNQRQYCLWRRLSLTMKSGLRLAGCCLQLPCEGGTCVVVLPQWIFGAVVLLHFKWKRIQKHYKIFIDETKSCIRRVRGHWYIRLEHTARAFGFIVFIWTMCQVYYCSAYSKKCWIILKPFMFAHICYDNVVL